MNAQRVIAFALIIIIFAIFSVSIIGTLFLAAYGLRDADLLTRLAASFGLLVTILSASAGCTSVIIKITTDDKNTSLKKNQINPDAPAEKRKVYCNLCKYFSARCHFGYNCLHPENGVDTPIRPIEGNCIKINKDNNCSHFEPKPSRRVQIPAKKWLQFWK